MSLPRALASALVFACLGCGGIGGTADDDDEPSCDMLLAVMPDPPTRGQDVTATAYTVLSGAFGPHEYSWEVRFDGQPIAFDTTSADQDVIQFATPMPGVYAIELGGSVGGYECSGARREINVLEKGARSQVFRLRVSPRPDDATGAPPQEREIIVWGGGNYNLGEVGIRRGVEVSGVSQDATGNPVAAYLRFSPTGGAPLLHETFAAADGSYRVRLLDEPHDFLVVPEPSQLPPYQVDGAPLASIPTETYVRAGNPVTVAVTDEGGAPLADARVALIVNGVRSSVGLTDAAGIATVQVSAEGPLSLSVVPPDGSGLPQLDLAAAGESGGRLAAGGGAIAVSYAPVLARTVSPEVRTPGGAPAPGSRVTWIARPLDGAGSVSIDSAPLAASGRVRVSGTADQAGRLPAALLPQAVYDVIVEPAAGAGPDQAVAMTSVDLGAGSPSALSLAPPAEIVGQILAPDRAPLSDVRIRAAPRDLLVGAPTAGASAVTGGDDGRFVLRVVGGGSYEITADGTSLGQGRVSLLVAAPPPGESLDLGPTALPRVLRADGAMAVESGGGRVVGAHLQLWCSSCGPGGTARPVVETMTDAAGGFVLIAPDPGVEPGE